MSVTQSLSVHLPEKEEHLDQEIFQPLDPRPSLGLSFLIYLVQRGDSRLPGGPAQGDGGKVD